MLTGSIGKSAWLYYLAGALGFSVFALISDGEVRVPPSQVKWSVGTCGQTDSYRYRYRGGVLARLMNGLGLLGNRLAQPTTKESRFRSGCAQSAIKLNYARNSTRNAKVLWKLWKRNLLAFKKTKNALFT